MALPESSWREGFNLDIPPASRSTVHLVYEKETGKRKSTPSPKQVQIQYDCEVRGWVVKGDAGRRELVHQEAKPVSRSCRAKYRTIAFGLETCGTTISQMPPIAGGAQTATER